MSIPLLHLFKIAYNFNEALHLATETVQHHSNTHSSHKEQELSFKPRAFSLRSDRSNHCSTVYPSMQHLTYLHPVGLPVAGADTGSEGASRHTADHHRHALLTGAVPLQHYVSAHITFGQVGLVAGAVDRGTPVVLLTTLS